MKAKLILASSLQDMFRLLSQLQHETRSVYSRRTSMSRELDLAVHHIKHGCQQANSQM